MNVFLLREDRDVSKADFVKYWAAGYDYDDEIYQRIIKKTRFTEKDVHDLFVWKNGMEFKDHVGKAKSVDGIKRELSRLNKLKETFSESEFHALFSSKSNIWQIFLLHIIDPDEFPIFDQYVYLTYQYLQHGSLIIPKNYLTTKKTIFFYRFEYSPFFEKFKSEANSSSRELDKAFWTFGRYIKNNQKLLNLKASS